MTVHDIARGLATGISSATTSISHNHFALVKTPTLSRRIAAFDPFARITINTDPNIAAYYQLLGMAVGGSQDTQRRETIGQDYLVAELRRNRGFFVDEEHRTLAPFAHWTQMVRDHLTAWSEAARVKSFTPRERELQRRQVARTGVWALRDAGVDEDLSIALWKDGTEIDIVKTNVLCSSPLVSIDHTMHLMSIWMHPIYLAFQIPEYTAPDVAEVRRDYVTSKGLCLEGLIDEIEPQDADDTGPVTGDWIESAEIRHAKASGTWERWHQEREHCREEFRLMRPASNFVII